MKHCAYVRLLTLCTIRSPRDKRIKTERWLTWDVSLILYAYCVECIRTVTTVRLGKCGKTNSRGLQSSMIKKPHWVSPWVIMYTNLWVGKTVPIKFCFLLILFDEKCIVVPFCLLSKIYAQREKSSALPATTVSFSLYFPADGGYFFMFLEERLTTPEDCALSRTLSRDIASSGLPGVPCAPSEPSGPTRMEFRAPEEDTLWPG